MNRWLDLEIKRRIAIIENISAKTALSAQAIEKDWWVTMTLNSLFLCGCSKSMVFKGGTSLSKGWKLVERFSEDVDLAIDRAFFGFEGDLNRKAISKLRRASCEYIRTTLKKELDTNLKSNGIFGYSLSIPESTDTTVDPQIIELSYNSLFDKNGYLLEKVLIEIGSRSMIEPCEEIPIRSLITESFPDQAFAEEIVKIPTVLPTRTFLEKAFLLHEEFSKPTDSIRTERMTRHLYDLERLMDTDFAKKALADNALYLSIIDHRMKLTSISGIDYKTHLPDLINFVPPKEVLEKWRDDYEKMRSTMIYGQTLSFDDLIKRITELNEIFRKI